MTITLNGSTGITTPDIDIAAGLDASDLTGALPAISGSALTSLTSANLTGALPAIDGSALTGVGGLQFISTIDLANDTVVQFTGFDASLYDSYEFTLSNVIAADNNAYIYVRMSSNGGSTYDAGSSDYSYINHYGRTATTSTTMSSISSSVLYINGSGLNSTAGLGGLSGDMKILGPHLAQPTMVVGQTTNRYTSTAVGIITSSFAGARLASTVVDAVAFASNPGTLTSGTITMYGKVNS